MVGVRQTRSRVPCVHLCDSVWLTGNGKAEYSRNRCGLMPAEKCDVKHPCDCYEPCVVSRKERK